MHRRRLTRALVAGVWIRGARGDARRVGQRPGRGARDHNGHAGAATGGNTAEVAAH
ncbi:MAG: hypothetical protein GY938_07785, partial [Ketobacter sp.]|nr:hypothetical protein [Ketobacter sp.]